MIPGTKKITTRINNYFYEQKLKHTKQIIMYNEQNIKGTYPVET